MQTIPHFSHFAHELQSNFAALQSHQPRRRVLSYFAQLQPIPYFTWSSSLFGFISQMVSVSAFFLFPLFPLSFSLSGWFASLHVL